MDGEYNDIPLDIDLVEAQLTNAMPSPRYFWSQKNNRWFQTNQETFLDIYSICDI